MTLIEKNQFEHVRTWLNGDRNYHRGMMLLMAYSPNKPLMASLKQWENKDLLHTYLMEMYQELKVKVDEEPVAEVKTPVANIEFAKDKTETIVKPILKKADLKKAEEIGRTIKKLSRDRGMWHAQMCETGLDDDGQEKIKLSPKEVERRFELAKLVMEATTQRSELYAITDHFAEYGTMPAEKKVKVIAATTMTKDEAFKKLKNSVAPNISKLKKKIAGSTDNAKIEDWTNQLTLLEQQKRELETLTNAS